MSDANSQPPRSGGNIDAAFPLLDRAISLLNEARRAVPAVDYALGVVGVGLAGYIIWFFVRDGGNLVLTLFGMYVAMTVLFVFAKASSLAEYKRYVDLFGVVLVGVTTTFFCASLLLSLSAVAFGKPEALVRFFHQTPPIKHRPGHWIHPGGSGVSDMRLETAGNELKFFYVKPREGMIEQGVKQGDLLFDGRIVGAQYQGTARVFKKGCQPIEFTVTGDVQASEYISLDGPYKGFASEGCEAGERSAYTRLIFVRLRD
jgi:hypothetical protein